MKIKLDEGAKMPTRAHRLDAGFDLYSRETKTIKALSSYTFDTGVHIELPYFDYHDGFITQKLKTVGLVMSKSGLNVFHGLTSEGVIDMGYTGSIKVKLYNNSNKDYTVEAGDKISQLLIMPVFTPVAFELVDSLEESERGNNGFGSSGK